jgi:hypothetical protein
VGWTTSCRTASTCRAAAAGLHHLERRAGLRERAASKPAYDVRLAGAAARTSVGR